MPLSLSMSVYILLFVIYLIGLWTAKERNPTERDTLPEGEVDFKTIVQFSGVFWLLSLLLPFFTPSLTSLNERWCVVIGASLSLFGTAFRAYAIRTLGRYFTYTLCIREQHELFEGGIYRYIRHPSYTGSLLEVIGMMIVARSVFGLVVFLFGAGFLIGLRVEREERMLRGHFGEKYMEYMKRTKRFVPWIY